MGAAPRPGAGRGICLALTLAAAAVAAGCGGSTADDLAELRAEAPPDVYFLGESFDGGELSHVEGGFFVYGTCEPGPDSGCAPPIQIQHLEFVAAQWAAASGCRRAGTIRGAPAVHHDSLIVLTRGSFVKIYATSDSQTRRAFAALRSVDGTIGPGEPLPRAAPPVVRAVLSACAPR